MMGERVVVLQHEGCEPFDYAVFNYDYRYTSNAGTHEAARQMALSLGATEPIEQKHRPFPAMPTKLEMRLQVAALMQLLEDEDDKPQEQAP